MFPLVYSCNHLQKVPNTTDKKLTLVFSKGKM